MENGCVLLPEWMEEVKFSTHGSQISANSLQSMPQGDRCLSGGGRRPCDGFPPPSLIGLMRNPNWTRIGLSSSVILGECVCVVGPSVLLAGGVGGFDPWEKSDSRAQANPCIMFQGYRLRSEDVVPFFFARRPIGSCNLVLFVHHRLMRGEKSVHDSRIGAEPFVHCET